MEQIKGLYGNSDISKDSSINLGNGLGECSNHSLITDNISGDVVCRNCGLVFCEKLIDHSAEWRSFTTDDYNHKTRVGAPFTMTFHDKGLSTLIDWRDKDAFGKALSPRKKAELYRLRKWNCRMQVHTSTDRNLTYAMSELNRMTSQLNCSQSIKENAAILYRKAIAKNLIRGRSIESMICACLYASFRIARIPLFIEDFLENTRMVKRDIERCYRILLKTLQIKVPNFTAKDFVSKFVNALEMNEQTGVKALEILKGLKSVGYISGKDPTGLAAAAIYIAGLMTGDKRTQKCIAQVAKVTEVTVRNRYKDLNTLLKLNIYPN